MSKRGFKRKIGSKEEYHSICIITEGEKTEPLYFGAIKQEMRPHTSAVKVEIMGKGKNTVSLVESAKRIMDQDDFDDVWVVFDEDGRGEQFNEAIKRAKGAGIRVAYSNEAFELWFLLHFNYMDSTLTRSQYCDKLTEILQQRTGNRKLKYEKNSKDMYSFLKEHGSEIDAVRNAEELLKIHNDDESFDRRNPSTTVHQLVQFLRNP